MKNPEESSPDNTTVYPRPIRDEKGRWVKGTPPPNPLGAPKRGRAWGDVVEHLSSMTLAELIEYVGGPRTRLGKALKLAPEHLTVKEALIVASFVSYGREPNARMLQALSDREDGKPAQAVDITSKGESVVPTVIEIVKKYDE